MELDLEKVVAKTREIAMKHPDARYDAPHAQTCKYLEGCCEGVEGKGCIVGRAIMAVHPEHEDILRQTDNNETPWHSAARFFLTKCFQVDPKSLDYHWLVKVQYIQDFGSTWGEAVKSADELVAKLSA